jgi:hypothetical protein
MSRSKRLCRSTGVALLLMCAVSSSAVAASVTISPGGSFSATSVGKVLFAAAGTNYQANVALSGTLSAGTFSVGSTPVGSVTNCTATGTLPVGFIVGCTESLPWGIGLSSATSASSATFTIQKAKIKLTWPNVGTCVFEGNLTTTTPYGALTALTLPGQSMKLAQTINGSCPGSTSLTGHFSVEGGQKLTYVP